MPADTKEWEELWKRFQEVVGFIYDNKGVIQSLEKQGKSASTTEAKATVEEQKEEIHLLLQNHQEELRELTEKAKKLVPSFQEDWKEYEKAINKLDTKTLGEFAQKMIKKKP